MWLPWDFALWLAAALFVVATVLRRIGRLERVRPVTQEAAIVLVLYATWRRLGDVELMGVGGAMGRGRWVWDVERWLHLPNEVTLQHWCAHATWLFRFANVYYIIFHVAPLGVFLVWLFFRHRERYAFWRNQLAFVSLTCIMIQFIPLAPPRMFPNLGFIDAGLVYGPTVYRRVDAGSLGQLAAMPSMHVAWALVIGLAAVTASKSRWRWLVLLHPILTVFAVTVTGYHWLLDGIVAAALLGVGLGLAVIVPRLPVVTRRVVAPAFGQAGSLNTGSRFSK